MTRTHVGHMLILVVLLALIQSSFGWIWPVSRSSTADLRQSSPFGPRQKASESFRYDFHRGIDIPAPLNTSLYAVHGGVVRLAGTHSGYSDTVLQITHTVDSINVYSTYLHLNAVYVSVSDVVTEGQFVATSGQTPSVPHLHFEIRKNGLLQRNCVNPWGYLPYVDTADLGVTVPSVISTSFGWNFTITVTCPSSPTELDFDFVYLKALDADNNVIAGLSRYNLSFSEINLEQTPFVGGSSNTAILDNPTIPSRSVVVSPFRYNGLAQYPVAGWNFTFYHVQLPSSTCKVMAYARDLSNNEVSAIVLLINDGSSSCSADTSAAAPCNHPYNGSYYYVLLCIIVLIIELVI